MIRAGPLGDRVELCLAAIEKLNETTCHCILSVHSGREAEGQNRCILNGRDVDGVIAHLRFRTRCVKNRTGVLWPELEVFIQSSGPCRSRECTLLPMAEGSYEN